MIVACAVMVGMMASCKNSAKNEALASKQATIDSLNNEIVKKQIIDSVSRAVAMTQTAPVANEMMPVASPVSYAAITPQRHTVHHYAARHAAHHYPVQRTYQSTYSGYAPAAAAQTAPAKKGWSDKAKGGVIGAGIGAVAGALIDRKKGQGALIGGLLGGASGIGVGALLDRRNR